MTSDERTLGQIAREAYERARSAPPDPCGHYHHANYPPQSECLRVIRNQGGN